MTDFTKGEWSIEHYATFINIEVDGVDIADVNVKGSIWSEKELANAALIAAAPDMYAMLERLQLNVADEIERDELLKKARGE